ncbi:hypothetical protein NPIL_684411 [Nephila pilipes]|uniref:Uncharacterized protein n=1 Tax=Nephila pilipes TaxID=299642 RepID=A0A8X6MT60_NEPPI|nr:hypothetical protein NPIL_684411 [Nephila pilipes]
MNFGRDKSFPQTINDFHPPQALNGPPKAKQFTFLEKTESATSLVQSANETEIALRARSVFINNTTTIFKATVSISGLVSARLGYAPPWHWRYHDLGKSLSSPRGRLVPLLRQRDGGFRHFYKHSS